MISNQEDVSYYLLWISFLIVEGLSIKSMLKAKVSGGHTLFKSFKHPEISFTDTMLLSIRIHPYSVCSSISKPYFISFGLLLFLNLWSFLGIFASIITTVFTEMIFIFVWELLINSQNASINHF